MLRLSYFQTPLLPYVSYLHHTCRFPFAKLCRTCASLRISLSSAFDLSQKYTEKITLRHRPKGQSLIAKPQPSGRKHSLSARSKTAMSFCAPCVCPENQSTTCHLDCQWRSIKLDVLCRARTLRVVPSYALSWTSLAWFFTARELRTVQSNPFNIYQNWAQKYFTRIFFCSHSNAK